MHAIDPFSFNIVLQNFVGIDDRAEFKVISLQEIDYFTAASANLEKKEWGYLKEKEWFSINGIKNKQYISRYLSEWAKYIIIDLRIAKAILL